jgi:hypothetical protein
LEEILSWRGHPPEVEIQVEMAKWELNLQEPGILHGGLNE